VATGLHFHIRLEEDDSVSCAVIAEGDRPNSAQLVHMLATAACVMTGTIVEQLTSKIPSAPSLTNLLVPEEDD